MLQTIRSCRQSLPDADEDRTARPPARCPGLQRWIRAGGEGDCEALSVTSQMGHNGFGYDPLFWPEDAPGNHTELELDEKNAISHCFTLPQNLSSRFRDRRRRQRVRLASSPCQILTENCRRGVRFASDSGQITATVAALRQTRDRFQTDNCRRVSFTEKIRARIATD